MQRSSTNPWDDSNHYSAHIDLRLRMDEELRLNRPSSYSLITFLYSLLEFDGTTISNLFSNKSIISL